MEEFVSVEDVKRVFKAFCSKEISGCGSDEQECEEALQAAGIPYRADTGHF